jgi:cellulose biosynthesis protein BcsQ
MNIVTVINAKGGCGKSTIAMSLASGLSNRGLPTLLIDMDPQAQVTQWLGAGDGIARILPIPSIPAIPSMHCPGVTLPETKKLSSPFGG